MGLGDLSLTRIVLAMMAALVLAPAHAPPPAQGRRSAQPGFVVVGARAGDVAAVRIVRGGQTVLEAPLAGPRFEWPAGAPELLADTDYELTVLFRTTRDEPATGTFRTLP